MTRPSWTDWGTPSAFRIRVSAAAAEKLHALPPETQDRLRQMLQDIAELADLVPPSVARSWRAGENGLNLMALKLGKLDVRYCIAEDDRTLTIEHVIVPEDDQKLGHAG
jgi:mRNA-degrading endonuclease RelE of RelBE toxin-antitoxin system